MKHKKLWAAGLLLSLNAATASATLIDRGNGLLYDTVLNVTWLQDANYAKTSGYAATGVDLATGTMTWAAANTWAAQLNVGGLSDWRLATNTPVNGTSFNTNFSFNGTTDVGYNITSPKSELAYMYNVNLGLKDYVSATNVSQASTFGVFGNGTFNGVNQNSFGQANVDPVNNLQAYAYWSGAEYSPGSGNAWLFATYYGSQSFNVKGFQLYSDWSNLRKIQRGYNTQI